MLNDHLGSVQILADAAGQLLEEFSYDPWGLRRNPVTLEVYAWAAMPVTGMDYGFTGHEHLDIFMLVNMNGRIYYPSIGRFLSPDPVLQFPNYTQGLNPYSYALNNPLRFVDPNGYSLVGQLAALTASMIIATIPGVNVILAPFVYSVIMTIDFAIENGRNVNAGEIIGYFMQTFAMSVVSMGATQGIGSACDLIKDKGLSELTRALAHGTFNGAMRFAQGGKFEHGFMSGFVSSLGGTTINNPNMSVGAKVAMSAVIGGTVEKLGGGKFANGAVTGAYVMMFNHLQTKRNVPSAEWLEQKIHEAIGAEKGKIQNWIDGKSGNMEIDLNYDNFDNKATAFGLYNDPVRYEIVINLGDQEFSAVVLYMPSSNTISNLVTDIKPAGISGYYGHLPGLKGQHQLFLNSHKWGGTMYTPAIIYLSKEAYNRYLIYTKDE